MYIYGCLKDHNWCQAYPSCAYMCSVSAQWSLNCHFHISISCQFLITLRPKLVYQGKICGALPMKYLQANATKPHWWLVNIGVGNGLVLSSNKPFPETMLTQTSVAVWYHLATMSLKEKWQWWNMAKNQLTCFFSVQVLCVHDSNELTDVDERTVISWLLRERHWSEFMQSLCFHDTNAEANVQHKLICHFFMFRCIVCTTVLTRWHCGWLGLHPMAWTWERHWRKSWWEASVSVTAVSINNACDDMMYLCWF